jgi:hypothetical protein
MGTRGRKSRGRRGRKRRAAEQQRKEEGRTYLPITRSQSRVAVGDGSGVGRGAARGLRRTEQESVADRAGVAASLTQGGRDGPDSRGAVACAGAGAGFQVCCRPPLLPFPLPIPLSTDAMGIGLAGGVGAQLLLFTRARITPLFSRASARHRSFPRAFPSRGVRLSEINA